MRLKPIFFLFFCFSLNFNSWAQNLNEHTIDYIKNYREWAIEEQLLNGIPATITLAQGIHETQSGQSYLAVSANNHFGIKCKKDWKGASVTHTDDAPNECFRKYASARDSYKDHSDYLKINPRYASCFKINPTDYAAWAYEIRKCGYATNPNYAPTLIKIIEDYQLQGLTLEALEKATKSNPVGEHIPEIDNAKPAIHTLENEVKINKTSGPHESEILNSFSDTLKSNNNTQPDDAMAYGKILNKNGLKGFYAQQGEVLLINAIRYNIDYETLLTLNDLKDEPLKKNQFVYLEKKYKKGLKPVHLIKPGETIYDISQDEGVQLASILEYNQLENNEEPIAGTMLHLQFPAASKPNLTKAVLTKESQPTISPIKSNDAPTFITKKPVLKLISNEPTKFEDTLKSKAPIIQNLIADTSKISKTDTATATTPQFPISVFKDTDILATAPLEANLPIDTIHQTVEVPKLIEKDTIVNAPQSEFEKLKAQLDQVVFTDEPKKTVAELPLTPESKMTPNVVEKAKTNPTNHIVSKGESLTQIAHKYHTTVAELMKINKFENQKQLKIGTSLKLPAFNSKLVPKSNQNEQNITIIPDQEGYHTIQKGETITALCKKFSLSKNELLILNNISDPNNLKTGMKIKVVEDNPFAKISDEKPKMAVVNKPKAVPQKSLKKESKFHIVENGDNIYNLAKKYKVSSNQIIELNHLENDSKLKLGQKLKLKK